MTQFALARSLSFKYGSDMVPIPIISQSCFYTCKSKESSQGRVYEHEIIFKMLDITNGVCDIVDMLQKTDTIHIVDVNDMGHVVKRGDLRFKFAIDKSITGVFGSFRGYEVNIKLTSLSPSVSSPL